MYLRTLCLSLACAAGAAFAQPQPPAPPSGFPAAPAPAPVPPDTVLVEVNGNKLTQGQLDARVKQMAAAQRIPPQFVDQIRPRIEQQIKEEFVIQYVLEAEATKQGIVTPAADVDKELERIKQSLPPQMTLEQAFAQGGTTIDEVKKDITRNLSIQQMVNKKIDALPKASDEELKTFFEANKEQFAAKESAKARHILIKTEGAEKDAAKKQIDDIHAKLVGGGDFASIAKEHSSCPSGQQGGDLGQFGRGQMVPEFEKAVFTQKVNEVGPIIETQFGFHIVQVTERTDAKAPDFAAAKPQVAEAVQRQAGNEMMKAYIEELKKTAKITYSDK